MVLNVVCKTYIMHFLMLTLLRTHYSGIQLKFLLFNYVDITCTKVPEVTVNTADCELNVMQ